MPTAVAVFDFASDTGYQLFNKIAVKHSLPNYVLVQNTANLADDDSLHSCAMLAPTPRFPTHSKAACWLSHAYYLQERDKIATEDRERIEKFLLKKAAFWDIMGDIETMIEREAAVIKQASEQPETFPLRTSEEQLAAATWLLDGYRKKQSHAVPISDRIDLAGRLIDSGIESQLPTNDAELLWKAACRRGCYDGRLVAEKLAASVILQPYLPAAKLAAVFDKLVGMSMQSQHKTAALACDKHRVFGDSPAELELAINTGEPVFVFPSGSVITKRAMDSFRHKEEQLLRAEAGRLSKVAFSTLMGDLADETADKLEGVMRNAGVSFVTRAPRSTSAIDFSLIR